MGEGRDILGTIGPKYPEKKNVLREELVQNSHLWKNLANLRKSKSMSGWDTLS